MIERLRGRQARAHRAAAQRIRIGRRPRAATRRPVHSTIRTPAAVERARARRRRGAQLQPRRRHPRRDHRHGRRHAASRSRRAHAAHAQLHRRRRRRVPRRPPWHAGRRPHRRVGQQWHRHRRRRAGRASSWRTRPAGRPNAAAAGRCNSFTLAQALADALTAKAQVINLSLVGPSDPLLEALVDKATGAGVIVVGAVSDDPRFGFPAKLPRVLPVAEAETSAEARERHPARAGARHRHAGAERPLRFRVRQLARHRAGSGVVALAARDAIRSSASTRMRELLTQSTEKTRHHARAVLSVNACVRLSRSWSCAARPARK